MSPQFTEFQEKRAKRTAPWKKRHLPARLRKAGDKLSLVLYPGAVPPGRLPRTGGPQSLPHAQCRPRPPSPRPGPPGGGRCPAVPLGPGCEHRWPLPTPPFTWLSSRAPGRLGQGPRRCGGGPGLACPSWASIQAHTCEGPFHRLPNESESHLEPTTSCSGRAGGQNRER